MEVKKARVLLFGDFTYRQLCQATLLRWLLGGQFKKNANCKIVNLPNIAIAKKWHISRMNYSTVYSTRSIGKQQSKITRLRDAIAISTLRLKFVWKRRNRNFLFSNRKSCVERGSFRDDAVLYFGRFSAFMASRFTRNQLELFGTLDTSHGGRNLTGDEQPVSAY